jgi:hypothetical protein
MLAKATKDARSIGAITNAYKGHHRSDGRELQG